MSDQREDYGAAGCASGCRDTIAGASVLMMLFTALVALRVRNVRVRRSDRLLDLLGSAVPETAPRGDLEDRLLAWRNHAESRPMRDVSALVDRFGGSA